MPGTRKLGRTTDHRLAMLKSLTTSLLLNGKIETTEAKAKEVELIYGAIKEAKPDDKLVAIKSLEALERVAEGPANKVFIPFDATKTLASVSALFEAK